VPPGRSIPRLKTLVGSMMPARRVKRDDPLG
jgi:hypothetical protein